MQHTNTTPLNINLSLTSDRNPYYQQLHQQLVHALHKDRKTTASYIQQRVRRDLEISIAQHLPSTPLEITNTLGVWEGGFEQSFQITTHDTTSNTINNMIKIAQHYAQDSIHFLRPLTMPTPLRPLGLADHQGHVHTHLWKFWLNQQISITDFGSILGQAGLGGGQLSADRRQITIYNAYNAHQSATEKAAAEATRTWETAARKITKQLQQHYKAKSTQNLAELWSYGTTPASATITYDQQKANTIDHIEQYTSLAYAG